MEEIYGTGSAVISVTADISDSVFVAWSTWQINCDAITRLPLDTVAACSGFMIGLIEPSMLMRGGRFKTALVVGAHVLSRYVDWTDRKTCILFGDATGVVVLKASTSKDNLLGYQMPTYLVEIKLHQKAEANQQILDKVTKKGPKEKVLSNLGSYGNTSAASISLVLYEQVRSGRVKPGDVIATAGFGTGFCKGCRPET
ncbi:hypothetical protein SELMODRAFT_423968 [Selaginella moellendorffii]|uniref:Beta-ketoacyl-[acyl-carrier-protein] synthase III C-terminal domain-containing protein n=1 Tax=Selaginella moellendorffii TaxID=88036 RepID=D8SND5_SELML|nr:hypothetical protein SELMODRAFT_423968 [Selaginella moellendorffii]